MTYSLNLNLGSGTTFTLTTETLGELTDEYNRMGGAGSLLVDRIKNAVPTFEGGKTAETAVAADTSFEPAESVDTTWEADGPWNNSGGSEKPAKPQRTDPWDNTPVTDSKPSGRRSAPPRGNSAPAVSTEGEGAFTEQDKFGRQWVLGLPDAPTCDCGEPAARLKAKAGPNAKQPGKPYTVWKCAKGAPSGDYRSKCDFSEFPN